jgi:hypothetical protein
MLKNILFIYVLTACMHLVTAYQIVAPRDAAPEASWTTNGPNNIVWQRVETDPDTFSIVLVNEVRPTAVSTSELFALNASLVYSSGAKYIYYTGSTSSARQQSACCLQCRWDSSLYCRLASCRTDLPCRSWIPRQLCQE